MNIVLIEKNELTENNIVQISDRRFEHITSIHRTNEGENVKVGIINGKIGTGTIIKIENKTLFLKVTLTSDPPPPLPAILFLSLPRPKTVKKVIPAVVSMGIKEIYLVNSYRVEKSYWQSPVISDENLLNLSKLGLEQGFDTIMPTIHKRKLFKPFVEDEIPNLIKNCNAYIPHPYCDNKLCQAESGSRNAIFIGPEGGFIPYEVNLLVEKGFQPVFISNRILRVENAAVATLAKLF